MSTDRDKELDEVQRDLGRPYIHEPDEKEIGQGAMCFLDRERLCGPDCASYIGENPLPHERCLILSSFSGVVLAVDELIQIRKERAQRAPSVTVTPSIPPPDPFGGKR